jgi:hypothetical protein
MDTVLLLHAAATWAMVGLIWFVQLVHYPLFASVGERHFARYEYQHTRRTAWVVGVLMPLEAVTGSWLVFDVPAGVSQVLATIGLSLIAALWLSTAVWQAPMHGRLSAGYNDGLHTRLITTNWVRTAGWTARGGLVLLMVGGALG